jgi:hypothetical protein
MFTEIETQLSPCICGCSYTDHLYNINMNPEGEAEFEALGCHDSDDCGGYVRPTCSCDGYEPQFADAEGEPLVVTDDMKLVAEIGYKNFDALMAGQFVVEGGN